MPIYYVNILLQCETMRIGQTKNTVANLLQLYAFTHTHTHTQKKKKKAASKTAKIEQTKSTIAKLL